eukprot:TRINITY_DN3227_c0_g2_i1.p1 TRINITY_DN3227_c0_g2~~TRINITY_DN3227_c0_g2_i1.p1  ORF type:complete len:141 (-),score=31.94 TRINITY_DN3227_c0_g2_i1:921-1343(-)
MQRSESASDQRIVIDDDDDECVGFSMKNTRAETPSPAPGSLFQKTPRRKASICIRLHSNLNKLEQKSASSREDDSIIVLDSASEDEYHVEEDSNCLRESGPLTKLQMEVKQSINLFKRILFHYMILQMKMNTMLKKIPIA